MMDTAGVIVLLTVSVFTIEVTNAGYARVSVVRPKFLNSIRKVCHSERSEESLGKYVIPSVARNLLESMSFRA
jgi:hypothetical protein